MNFTEIYKDDIFANQAGITLQELNDTHALMYVDVKECHLNGGNVTHGGLIFTLADIAMAAIANHINPGSVSIQSDIRFVAPSFSGERLTAEAIGVFGRKSLYNCRVTITNQNGETVAIAEGMYHVKRNFR